MTCVPPSPELALELNGLMRLSNQRTAGLDMAQTSLDIHMREEVAFLGLFDRVKRHIDER